MSQLFRIFVVASVAALAWSLSTLCQAAYAAEPQVIDGIAAQVNGDIITYS
ncbi:MAG: hypothetical protein QOI34_916, partial [Verrucomicrobiota bacterium]